MFAGIVVIHSMRGLYSVLRQNPAAVLNPFPVSPFGADGVSTAVGLLVDSRFAGSAVKVASPEGASIPG